MIKLHKDRIELFLEYYKNGYSELPGEAFVKAGFVESLKDAESAYLYKELMSNKIVVREIGKFTKDKIANSQKVLTKVEKAVHLSNLVRGGSLFREDKDGAIVLKDSKNVIAAIKELNLMYGDYSPTKNSMELTGKDGKSLSIANTISLDLSNLTEDDLRKIDKSIEGK